MIKNINVSSPVTCTDSFSGANTSGEKRQPNIVITGLTVHCSSQGFDPIRSTSDQILSDQLGSAESSCENV